MVRGTVLRLSMALSVLLASGAMVVVAVSSARATQGQAVIAGQVNTSTAETVVNDTDAGRQQPDDERTRYILTIDPEIVADDDR